MTHQEHPTTWLSLAIQVERERRRGQSLHFAGISPSAFQGAKHPMDLALANYLEVQDAHLRADIERHVREQLAWAGNLECDDANHCIQRFVDLEFSAMRLATAATVLGLTKSRPVGRGAGQGWRDLDTLHRAQLIVGVFLKYAATMGPTLRHLNDGIAANAPRTGRVNENHVRGALKTIGVWMFWTFRNAAVVNEKYWEEMAAELITRVAVVDGVLAAARETSGNNQKLRVGLEAASQNGDFWRWVLQVEEHTLTPEFEISDAGSTLLHAAIVGMREMQRRERKRTLRRVA